MVGISSRMLIVACGNPSRGDDALGPLLIERLGALPEPGLGPRIDLMGDFQLQVEHALDLVDRDRAVFVDAALCGPEPFAFVRVAPDRDASITTHAMSPGALLRVYRQVTGTAPPAAWLLAIRGYRFGLGEGMSPGARANLDAATAFLLDWVRGAG